MPSVAIKIHEFITQKADSQIVLAVTIVCLFLLGSCAKNVKLDDIATDQMVIEGYVAPGYPPVLRLSRSVSPTEENVFPEVTNATVTLDNDIDKITLTHTGNGSYSSSSAIPANPNLNYQLSVTEGDQNYTAHTTIPTNKIQIDSIVTIPAVNDSLQAMVYMTALTSGDLFFQIYAEIINQNLQQFVEISVESGESIVVPTFQIADDNEYITFAFVEITEQYRAFLEDLSSVSNEQIIGGLLIGPPANLEGNIENGLGYFTGIYLQEWVLEF